MKKETKDQELRRLRIVEDQSKGVYEALKSMVRQAREAHPHFESARGKRNIQRALIEIARYETKIDVTRPTLVERMVATIESLEEELEGATATDIMNMVAGGGGSGA